MNLFLNMKILRWRYLLIILFVCYFHNITFSQKNITKNSEFEISLSILNSPPLIIEPNYELNPNKATIESFNSIGYSFSFRYKKNRNNLKWLYGFNSGIYSININLELTENFRYLGWGGYNEKIKELSIAYIAPEIGIEYTLLKKLEKSELTISASLLASYHLRLHAEFTASAIISNGTSKGMFYSEFVNNNNNNIFLAPKLNIKYIYYLESHQSIFIGIDSIFSKRTPFSGRYEVYGDSETLNGNMKKEYQLIGFTLGYIKSIR